MEWCNRMEHYDVVFMSKVFDETYTPDIEWEPNADIIVKGGTGYIRGGEVYKNGTWVKRHDIQVGKELYQDVLPTHVEHEYPDYSLYPELTKDTAYGYLTRGCPRACEFCLVAEKEGRASRKVAELSEFWRGQKKIKLMDPNILACRDHLELLQQLADSGACVDFTQGLDIRLITEGNIDVINSIKVKEIHFAWDNPRSAMTGHFLWYRERAKHKPHGKFGTVYVLVNYWSDLEQDLNRIYTLDTMGYDPYVMIYNKPTCDPVYLDLQRWCNRPAIRKKCPNFDDYKAGKKDERQMEMEP